MNQPNGIEGITYHSFSSLDTYVSRCPLQYFYKYVERRAPEQRSVHLVFGSAINEALVMIDWDLLAGRAADLRQAQGAFETRLRYESIGTIPPVDFGKETFGGLLEKGRLMIEKYVSELDPEERPLSPEERRFSVPIVDHDGKVLPRYLVGEFDRVLDVGGAPAIVDWKTAARRWSQLELDNDLQATTYEYAARMKYGKKPAFFRFDFLLKTKEPVIERRYVDRKDWQIRRFVKIVREVDHAIESGVFIPRDKSQSCSSCPYRAACERWAD